MAAPGGTPNPANMPAPDMKPMLAMLIAMVMIFGLYAIDGKDHIIGGALNVVFQIFSFDGKYPIATLMIIGAIMIILTSALRTFFTDTIKQQKSQAFNSAFQKEMRQARLENNTFKLKKLMEMQPQVMAKTMESSNQMMKTMPITMIVVVPMFLWVRYFVNVTLQGDMRIISIPWAMIGESGGLDITATAAIFPSWVLIYSLISIPIGQIVMRLVRTYQFKKRLAELEAEEVSQEVA